jgi:replication-associated recombination protein RarA
LLILGINLHLGWEELREVMGKSVFRKILENMVFAMNLSDDNPEHIMTEIMRIKDRDAVNEMEAIFGTPVDFESVEDFNEEVNRKLKPRIGQQIVTRQEVVQQSEEFFSEIVGYSDIKELFMKCIQSNNTHVILDGPPASAKSLFLHEMLRNLGYDAYFVDCTNASGPGLVDYLFENDVKYLLLDEVEKMSNRDQNVLLNLMETGILTSTKVKKTRSKKMDISIYATTNDIEELSKPFRSRFMEFSLPPYTYDEFCDIVVNLLGKKYNHDKELSLKIADTVWNKIKSRDIRDLLQVGKLSKTLDDVDFVVNTLQKYKRKKGFEDWENGRVGDDG